MRPRRDACPAGRCRRLARPAGRPRAGRAGPARCGRMQLMPERTRADSASSPLAARRRASPVRGFRERRALRRRGCQAEWAALPSARGSAAAPPSRATAADRGYAGARAGLGTSAQRQLAGAAGARARWSPASRTTPDGRDGGAGRRPGDRRGSCPGCDELAAPVSAASGSAPLLDEVPGDESVTPDEVAAAFDYAWHRSILDQIRVRDPDYGAEYGAPRWTRSPADFRLRDVEHLAANRARVRSAWACQLREAVDRHPLQARVIRKQAALRRGHLPLRRLLDQTGDVLFALKPCWAMSPLMVSQVLPLARLFDLVIFDEASQIVPGRRDRRRSSGRTRSWSPGDDRQLPPTNFFRQVDAGDDGRRRGSDDERGVVRRRLRVGPRRAPAAAADLPAELALPQPGRAAGGVLQRPDLRRRADHVPRRGPRRLPAARGRRPGRRAGPGGASVGRRGDRGRPA